MKKLINGLLYSLLVAVAAAGLAGVAHFTVQEKERETRWEEAERRLALEEQEKASLAGSGDHAQGQDDADVRTVFVKKLPVYQKKKITKAASGMETLSYGDQVTVLEEDGLYAKVRTGQDHVGYVWNDCIGAYTGGQHPASAPKVLVLDVKLTEQDADMLCLKLAADLKKRLEGRGYQAVLAVRAGESVEKEERRARLANQIQADVLLQIGIGSGKEEQSSLADDVGGSSEPAENETIHSAVAYCAAADSPVAKYRSDSRKLGKKILNHYAKQTGISNGGVRDTSDGTGINQSKMPAVLLNLGETSDSDPYGKMKKAKFQAKMVKGIADGIEAYFGAPGKDWQ